MSSRWLQQSKRLVRPLLGLDDQREALDLTITTFLLWHALSQGTYIPSLISMPRAWALLGQ